MFAWQAIANWWLCGGPDSELTRYIVAKCCLCFCFYFQHLHSSIHMHTSRRVRIAHSARGVNFEAILSAQRTEITTLFSWLGILVLAAATLLGSPWVHDCPLIELKEYKSLFISVLRIRCFCCGDFVFFFFFFFSSLRCSSPHAESLCAVAILCVFNSQYCRTLRWDCSMCIGIRQCHPLTKGHVIFWHVDCTIIIHWNVHPYAERHFQPAEKWKKPIVR